MEFDWFTADADARRALYEASKRAVFERFQGDWNAFLSVALDGKASVGSGYIDNFRAGRISRVRSGAIARWLALDEPQIAATLASDLARRATEPRFGWSEYIEAVGEYGRLTLLRSVELNIVSLASRASGDAEQVRSGEEFYLQLEAGLPGTAMAFQRVRGLWFPLPLSDTNSAQDVDEGTNVLPRSFDSGLPIALREDSETGTIEFSLIVSADPIVIAAAQRAGVGLPDETLAAFATAISLSSLPFEVHRMDLRVV